jgi:predicted amidohydrolase
MEVAAKRKHQKLKVALAQIDCSPGDTRLNLAKIKRLIDECRGEVDLLVFPEYALSGYVTGQTIFDCALRTDDELFLDVVGATGDITVALGFIEEAPAFNFYNSLAILRNGQILGVHRKIYLINYGVFEERKHLSVGPSYQCIDLGAFRMAPFICGDAWNPALVHLAAADLAHIFVFPACSPTSGLGTRLSTKESWKRLNRFYASIYGVYVLFVNRVGEDQGLEFWGQSEVIDPFGVAVASTDDDGEELIRAEVDLGQVREARTILHTVRDEDLDFIQRRLQKVINQQYL